jgi:hypothetical protein
MIGLNRCWLGGFAVAVTLFPGGVRAPGAGALIAWALTGDESGASNSRNVVGVVPVLSPSRKGLVVTLALK